MALGGAGCAARRPGSGRPGPPAAVVQVQAQTGGSAPGRRATPAPASATGLGRRSVTALQRQAAIEGWKRLIREGKLHRFASGATQILGHTPIQSPVVRPNHFVALDTGCGTCPPFTLSALVLRDDGTSEIVRVS